MRLGFHLSIAGSLRRSLTEARILGCQALQIFVQNPRSWKWRSVSPEEIRQFRTARRQSGLDPLVVHLSYLPNLAAADSLLYRRSQERFTRELEVARDLGADYLVAHPGHAPLAEASFQRVALALTRAIAQVGSPPLVLLENTAGQGRELGWQPAHLARIMSLSAVPLGLCLDTAHAYGAGYDLGTAQGATRLLADIAQGPGLDQVKMLHLNDSKARLGSRVDRHWHLGQGTIGLAGLRQFFSHPCLRVPVAIMETPKRHLADDFLNLLVARSLAPSAALLP
jgi:deoxyribonuclease-4